jgi:hypothetical protein
MHISDRCKDLLAAFTIGLVLTMLLFGGSTGAAKGQPQASGTIDGTYTANQGETVKIDISISNAETATLTIGGGDSGYKYTAEIQPHSDSEQITLIFDTYTAGSDKPPVRLSDGSNADLVGPDAGQSVPGALAPTDYELTLTANGIELDKSLLTLKPASLDNTSSHIAPEHTVHSSDDLDRITDNREVAKGDELIFKVESTGFDSLLEGRTGYDFAKSSDFSQKTGMYIEFVEKDVGRNQARTSISPSEADIYYDGDLYFVYETDDISVEPGDEFNFTFAIDDRSKFIADGEIAKRSTSITVKKRKIEFTTNADGQIELGKGNALQLKTPLAPGTELEIVGEASTTEAEYPFIERSQITLGESQTIEYDPDAVSKLDHGERFLLTVDDIIEEQEVLIALKRSASFTVNTPPEVATNESTVVLYNSSKQNEVVARGMADSNGKLSFSDLPPAELHAYAYNVDYRIAPETFKINLSQRDYEKTLDLHYRKYNLTIKSVNETDSPVKSTVTLKNKTRGFSQTSADTINHTFSVRSGIYRATAQADGRTTQNTTIYVFRDTSETVPLIRNQQPVEPPANKTGETSTPTPNEKAPENSSDSKTPSEETETSSPIENKSNTSTPETANNTAKTSQDSPSPTNDQTSNGSLLPISVTTIKLIITGLFLVGISFIVKQSL